MKKKLPALLAVLFLLIVWEIIAWPVNKPEIVPSVSRLLMALGELIVSPSFYQSVGVTILRGLAGMSLSLVTACVFAFLFTRYSWLYEFFRPLLAIMRSIPVVSFILLALIYLHPESIPLLIAFLVMFPLLTENLTKGLLHLHPGYKMMAEVFLIKGKNKVLQVYYPQLKPFLFSGLASAMGFGWRAIIMGEVLSQCTSGIGSEMKRAQIFIEVPELLAWTIIAILISFIFDKGISRLEKVKVPIAWQEKDKELSSVSSEIIMTNVGFAYHDKQVLSHFTYTFKEKRVYGISAPSGKGKTTLLNVINGILIPAEGSVRINRSQGIACIFQEPGLLPYLPVLENIILPLAASFTKETAIHLTQETMVALDIASLINKLPGELSYGQQQRVAIARALVYPSPILLMDEPFKGLDEALIHRIISYIQEKQTENNQTIIFTTHKQEELSLLADDVIHL